MKAEAIAKALNGQRAGAGSVAHCSAHNDRMPSLPIRDTQNGGRPRCRASCERVQQ
jgi:hypothetical protein